MFPRLRSRWVDHQLTESSDAQFWADIYSLEVPSNECLSWVQSLLSSPSKITVARSFQGSEAQTFVDFLDRVSKLCPPCYTD